MHYRLSFIWITLPGSCPRPREMPLFAQYSAGALFRWNDHGSRKSGITTKPLLRLKNRWYHIVFWSSNLRHVAEVIAVKWIASVQDNIQKIPAKGLSWYSWDPIHFYFWPRFFLKNPKRTTRNQNVIKIEHYHMTFVQPWQSSCTHFPLLILFGLLSHLLFIIIHIGAEYHSFNDRLKSRLPPIQLTAISPKRSVSPPSPF